MDKNQERELEYFIKDKNHSIKEIKKAQVILMLNKRLDLETIEYITGYSRRQCFEIRKKYLVKGIVAIEDKKRKNPKELLSKKQREEIIAVIRNSSPKDSHYDSDYWTTSIVGDLIWREYQIKYKSKTSIYLIFKRAKFSYHKPDRKYQARNEQEVSQWKREAEIKLNQALRETNTVVLTADEMSLSTQTTIQKVWLPQGEYPKIEVATKRDSRSIYGFLNIKDGTEHAFKTKWQNMYITYEVLGELRKIYPNQKLLIFWDKAPWHKGSKAQQFIKEDGNIETFDFPRAAPEENPQEHVWKSGRSKVTHNEFIKDINQATDEFIGYLNETKFNYSFLGFSAG
ncbi:MAG: IS630 family transposase [Candidatus Omnitrophica bacterium]|nr:IS630 family transposase [Candidatus Omnitrophota bacterium]